MCVLYFEFRIMSSVLCVPYFVFRIQYFVVCSCFCGECILNDVLSLLGPMFLFPKCCHRVTRRDGIRKYHVVRAVLDF